MYSPYATVKSYSHWSRWAARKNLAGRGSRKSVKTLLVRQQRHQLACKHILHQQSLSLNGSALEDLLA